MTLWSFRRRRHKDGAKAPPARARPWPRRGTRLRLEPRQRHWPGTRIGDSGRAASPTASGPTCWDARYDESTEEEFREHGGRAVRDAHGLRYVERCAGQSRHDLRRGWQGNHLVQRVRRHERPRGPTRREVGGGGLGRQPVGLRPRPLQHQRQPRFDLRHGGNGQHSDRDRHVRRIRPRPPVRRKAGRRRRRVEGHRRRRFRRYPLQRQRQPRYRLRHRREGHHLVRKRGGRCLCARRPARREARSRGGGVQRGPVGLRPGSLQHRRQPRYDLRHGRQGRHRDRDRRHRSIRIGAPARRQAGRGRHDDERRLHLRLHRRALQYERQSRYDLRDRRRGDHSDRHRRQRRLRPRPPVRREARGGGLRVRQRHLRPGARSLQHGRQSRLDLRHGRQSHHPGRKRRRLRQRARFPVRWKARGGRQHGGQHARLRCRSLQRHGDPRYELRHGGKGHHRGRDRRRRRVRAGPAAGRKPRRGWLRSQRRHGHLRPRPLSRAGLRRCRRGVTGAV